MQFIHLKRMHAARTRRKGESGSGVAVLDNSIDRMPTQRTVTVLA
jgi:hypothetical protein